MFQQFLSIRWHFFFNDEEIMKEWSFRMNYPFYIMLGMKYKCL